MYKICMKPCGTLGKTFLVIQNSVKWRENKEILSEGLDRQSICDLQSPLYTNTKGDIAVGDENVCIACGDLKDDIGRCYTCSEDHVELRKDFIWEYCHEIDTLVDSQFRRILPDCDYSQH